MLFAGCANNVSGIKNSNSCSEQVKTINVIIHGPDFTSYYCEINEEKTLSVTKGIIKTEAFSSDMFLLSPSDLGKETHQITLSDKQYKEILDVIIQINDGKSYVSTHFPDDAWATGLLYDGKVNIGVYYHEEWIDWYDEDIEMNCNEQEIKLSQLSDLIVIYSPIEIKITSQ